MLADDAPAIDAPAFLAAGMSNAQLIGRPSLTLGGQPSAIVLALEIITRAEGAPAPEPPPVPPIVTSGLFDGTGDFLSLASDTLLDVGSGDFTLEFWAYPTANTNSVDSVFGYGAFTMMLYHSSSGNWTFEMSNNGISNQIVLSFARTLNAWAHIAVVKSGTGVTVYRNGASVGTGTITGSVNTSGKSLRIGDNNVGSNQFFTGNISNFRLVKGVAIYTAPFTPPTSPLTAVAGTSLLTCNAATFVDGSGNSLPITVNGNAVVSSLNPF
ncbi:MAG: LamG domain-containing protein [Roseomonas sp.]|nr:LamG domain-containing protein [Roseomonas sp.]